MTHSRHAQLPLPQTPVELPNGSSCLRGVRVVASRDPPVVTAGVITAANAKALQLFRLPERSVSRERAGRFQAMPRRLFVLIPIAGVLIASSAAIMIRFAQAGGYPSTSLAAGRLGIAALLLWVYRPVASARELGEVSRRDLVLCALSGVFLALHFGFWITSLEFTSVAGSVALVTTSPLWVGLLGPLFLRERPRLMTMIAALVAIAGAVLIGLGDALIDLEAAATGLGAQAGVGLGTAATGLLSGSLRGNILALLGAVSVSGYLLIGRAVRARVSLGSYVRLVYGCAAAALVFYTVVRGIPLLPPNPQLLLWAVLMAIGPQLLGHTSFNWALKHFSTVVVTVIILGEPVGSALLAAALLGEFPSAAPVALGGAVYYLPLQVTGIVILLSGVVLATRSE